MRCYGIVDIVMWLLQRKEQLDLAQLKSLVETNGKVKRQNKTRFQELLKICENRIPKSSANYRELQKIKKRHRNYLSRRNLLVGAIGAVAFYLILMFYGPAATAYYAAAEHISSPETTVEDLRKDREALRASRHGWRGWFTSITFWNDDIAKKIQEVDKQTVDLAWKLVVETNDPIQKSKKAAEFIQRYPNSEHIQQAYQLSRLGDEIANKEWIERIEPDNARLEAMKMADLDDLAKKLELGFPHQESITEEQRARRTFLLAKTNARRNALAQEMDFLKFKKRVQDIQKRDEIDQVVALLGNRMPKDTQWLSLGKTIMSDFPDYIAQMVRKNSNDELTYNRLQKLEKALKNYETELRRLGSVTSWIRLTKSELEKIEVKRDKKLYEAVRKYRDLKACENYLNQAPLKRMKRAVEKLQARLLALDGPLDVQVTVDVRIPAKFETDSGFLSPGGNMDLQLSFTIDNEDMKKRLSAWRGRTYKKELSFKRKNLKPSDHISIKCSILELDAISSNDDYGSGEITVSRDKLVRSVNTLVVHLPSEKSKKMDPIEIVLHGEYLNLPPQPELPDWK